jgi:microcystin-dependent protein
MSYPYYTLGISFESIFEPYYQGAPQADTTGYRVPDGSGGWVDLNTKYLKWDGFNTADQTYYTAPKTENSVTTYVDLNEIFCKKIIIPSGTVIILYSNDIPAGYLLCDGTSYSPSGTYSGLFAAIGYTYGNDNGNFRVPNFNNYKMPYYSISQSIGVSGGVESVNLDANNIPSHNHGKTNISGTHNHSLSVTNPDFMYSNNNWGAYPTEIYPRSMIKNIGYSNFANTSSDSSNIAFSGNSGEANPVASNNSYDVKNPYIVVCYIIRL